MEIFNRILCGFIMPFFLISLGIYFAFKLRFFYILHPIRTFKTILSSQKEGFKSLSVALSGTLGVGNIVGVSSAIFLGGAGSIFWMWLSALCAMSVKYAEVYLAMIFRQKKDEKFFGGSPYYINEGLSKKLGAGKAYFLSIIFAFFCIINSLSTGNLVQINSVSSLSTCSSLAFGIIFAILSFLAIIGGIKRIAKVTSVLIPILSLSYILLCLYIILARFNDVPKIFNEIFKDAFSLKCATSGFLGYGIIATIRYGISRGVLSNEAGCGTSPSAHASSDCTDPHAQACLGIFEVFVDTILLCTLTAIVILLIRPENATTPMELVLFSFEKVAGSFGSIAISVIAILFAFATVICQFFYGSEALSYITKKQGPKHIYMLVFLLIMVIGAVIPMSLMWEISDISIGVMTVVNLACIFLLREHIK